MGGGLRIINEMWAESLPDAIVVGTHTRVAYTVLSLCRRHINTVAVICGYGVGALEHDDFVYMRVLWYNLHGAPLAIRQELPDLIARKLRYMRGDRLCRSSRTFGLVCCLGRWRRSSRVGHDNKSTE